MAAAHTGETRFVSDPPVLVLPQRLAGCWPGSGRGTWADVPQSSAYSGSYHPGGPFERPRISHANPWAMASDSTMTCQKKKKKHRTLAVRRMQERSRPHALTPSQPLRPFLRRSKMPWRMRARLRLWVVHPSEHHGNFLLHLAGGLTEEVHHFRAPTGGRSTGLRKHSSEACPHRT